MLGGLSLSEATFCPGLSYSFLSSQAGYNPSMHHPRLPISSLRTATGASRPITIAPCSFLKETASALALTFEHLDLKPGESVLDLGCGTGISFERLHGDVGPQGRIIGVELSPEMLELAAGGSSGNGWSNVTLIEGDANTVDIPGPLDAALAFFVPRSSIRPLAVRRALELPFKLPAADYSSIRREARPRAPGSAVQFLFPGEVQDLAMGGRKARHPQNARQRPAVCRPGSRRPQSGALGLYVWLRLRGTGNQGVPNPSARATSVERIAGPSQRSEFGTTYNLPYAHLRRPSPERPLQTPRRRIRQGQAFFGSHPPPRHPTPGPQARRVRSRLSAAARASASTCFSRGSGPRDGLSGWSSVIGDA